MTHPRKSAPRPHRPRALCLVRRVVVPTNTSLRRTFSCSRFATTNQPSASPPPLRSSGRANGESSGPASRESHGPHRPAATGKRRPVAGRYGVRGTGWPGNLPSGALLRIRFLRRVCGAPGRLESAPRDGARHRAISRTNAARKAARRGAAGTLYSLLFYLADHTPRTRAPVPYTYTNVAPRMTARRSRRSTLATLDVRARRHCLVWVWAPPIDY